MAKTKIVTDAEVGNVPPAPAPPTLAAAAEASNEAKALHLAELQAKADGTPAPTEPAAKTPDELYQEQWAALPEDFREQYAQNIIRDVNANITENLGPEITAVLAEVGADPELKKALSRMSDKKAREWILKTAFPIYDDERFASPVGGDGTPAPNPQLEELTKTVTSLKTEREVEKQKTALEALQNERIALENTFPELKWSDPNSKEYKRTLAVVEETMERRAKGKPVTMAEVYSEYKDMWDFQAANLPPRAAPATSSATITGPQAPRTKFESRAGMRGMLDKHGSIGHLAAALKR